MAATSQDLLQGKSLTASSLFAGFFVSVGFGLLLLRQGCPACPSSVSVVCPAGDRNGMPAFTLTCADRAVRAPRDDCARRKPGIPRSGGARFGVPTFAEPRRSPARVSRWLPNGR